MSKAAQRTRTRRSIVTTGLGVIAAASLMLTPAVWAQDIVSLSGLKLKDTHIKTGLPTTFAAGQFPFAVDPVILHCPGPNKHSTCTLEIQLQTLFSNVSDGSVAGAAVTFTDKTGVESANGISPVNTVGMDSTSHDGMSNTRGWTWIKADLKKGWYRINSYLTVTDGEAGSFTRTLIIRVYN